MTILWFALGGVVGWLLTLAADVLPRFAQTLPPRRPAAWRPPGVLRWHRDRAALPDAAVELITALLFMLAGALMPPAQALLVSAACAFFILTALIDLRYRLILNVTTYPAFVILALLHGVNGASALTSAVLGASFAFVIFYGTARLKPGQLGMGDVKLATVIGFGFGFPGVLFALLIGAGAGGVAAIAMLASKHRATRTIPYAPFLCLGALAVLFIPMLRL
jgi:leader peptidase (prepilin peptidase)/N-methyltransferase